jgi:hypothetical protein
MKKALLLSLFLALLFSAVAMLQRVSLTTANVGYHDPISPDIPYGPVSPFPNPPDLIVQSPKYNTTYHVDEILLNFTVVNPYSQSDSTRITEISYNYDGQGYTLWNVSDSPLASTQQFSIVLNPDVGPHTLQVNVHSELTFYPDPRFLDSPSIYPIDNHETIPFVIDLNVPPPPSVSLASPENKTYITFDVPLNFTVNESSSQISYSLDGKDNVTTAGNTTLTGLTTGGHSITIYATNVAGNIGASETITFTVAMQTGSFPIEVTAVVIVSVSIIAPGLAVYLKKRKR